MIHYALTPHLEVPHCLSEGEDERGVLPAGLEDANLSSFPCGHTCSGTQECSGSSWAKVWLHSEPMDLEPRDSVYLPITKESVSPHNAFLA